MGIRDSKGDSPEIAELFFNKFAEIAAEGRGKDKDYAGVRIEKRLRHLANHHYRMGTSPIK